MTVAMRNGGDILQPGLIVGIYGTFRREKLIRELKPGFAGVEVSCLPSLEEAKQVAAFAEDNGLQFGVHFPLVKGRYEGIPLHPYITGRHEERLLAFSAIEQDMRDAKELGASYLLLHFPKPALLEPGLDWSDWRFPDQGEAIWASDYNIVDERALAFSAFARLFKLSKEIGLSIVLEHDITHPVHYQQILPELFAAFPGIGFCIDTGRLHMQEHTDPGFSAIEFINRMLPYITNVHLWTVRLGQNKAGGHHPLLPELKPEEGWGDMAAYLSVLSGVEQASVLFEHRADLVSADDLDRCYQWVESVLRGE